MEIIYTVTTRNTCSKCANIASPAYIISQQRFVFPVHVECLFWLCRTVFISCFEYICCSVFVYAYEVRVCVCVFHGCESFQLFTIYRPYFLLESDYHSAQMHFFHPCYSVYERTARAHTHRCCYQFILLVFHVSSHFSSVQFSSTHSVLFHFSIPSTHCGI